MPLLIQVFDDILNKIIQYNSVSLGNSVIIEHMCVVHGMSHLSVYVHEHFMKSSSDMDHHT